ncbi:short-chain dehydrogenase [bacterium SCGC AG-212-C10]|nr:short-chain dehydrogenase [bacterium SCGC AG-212-C10]
MDLGLTGKRALITGGSKGIGLAAATRMAQEGASVAIVARRLDALEEAKAAILAVAPGANVLCVSADVSTAEGTAAAAAEVLGAFGGLDILVNNAGRSAGGRALEQDDSIWQTDLDLKFFGALRMTRLCHDALRESGAGAGLNVTAIQGKTPTAGASPTAISRAAGIALTKALSKELAPENIRVNTVCIGLIKSEQIERAARGRFPDLPLDQAYARMGEGVPLGRVGETEEAGDVIAFLCSPRAGFVTGVALNLDGGTASVT